MKKFLSLCSILGILFASSISAEELQPDLMRTLLRMRGNMEFFSQMAVKNYADNHKGRELESLDLLPRVKELMNKDKYYISTMYIFKDFSADEMDLYMTLKWSDFMKKVQMAESLMKELNLPTYEKEIELMLNEKKH
jgi:hypothetical protein